MSTDDKQYLLLYDGECPFCRKTVEILSQKDTQQRLHFLDLHQPENLELFPSITLDDAMRQMHLKTSDDRIYGGARALPILANILPGFGWLVPFLSLPLMARLAEILYRWIARNRYHLVSCDINQKSGKHCP